jgi:hypothetical protein
MTDERRQAVDRMFRARLSWTLVGGMGLIGLTSGLEVGLRGVLLAGAVGAFVWLNRPLLLWMLAARRAGDTRWRPAAIGLALRVVGMVVVLSIAW